MSEDGAHTGGLSPADRPTLGFAGLGAMGGAIARNLLAAGYRLLAYDTNSERLDACVAGGAAAAPSAAALAQRCDVVLTSLPSSEAFVEVAEAHFLPNARAGQIYVDVGTVAPPETRRLAAAFAGRGAALVDAPVSGGPAGAASRSLLVFAGGDPAAVERCRPLLDVLGGDGGRITYCGPAGSGQVVKGVNQLAMGLGNAAFVEAVAFGVNAGVDAGTIAAAVGGDEGWRAIVRSIATRAATGQADGVGVKFRELPYFLREAQERGFPLPLTEALYAFCDRGERLVVDDNRPAPSFFHELTQDGAGGRG